MKKYILTTSIGTFNLKEPLAFAKECKRTTWLLSVGNYTEAGLDSELNLNLKLVDLLGYYEIEQGEEKS